MQSMKIQDGQTLVSPGKAINVENTDTLKIQISGTSTSFTVLFENSLDGVKYSPITGDNLSDGSTSSSTTSKLNESWEFDTEAVKSFRANITNIGNGYVTVTANFKG